MAKISDENVGPSLWFRAQPGLQKEWFIRAKHGKALLVLYFRHAQVGRIGTLGRAYVRMLEAFRLAGGDLMPPPT